MNNKPQKKVVLTTIHSDSHTWNLVFMELWLHEQGLKVINLGSCVPVEEVVNACQKHQPFLLVVSTVNGHGGIEGQNLIRALEESGSTRNVTTVIGGKMATRPEYEMQAAEGLLRFGFSAVLTGPNALESLASLIYSTQTREVA